MTTDPVVVDFETLPIIKGSGRAPKPVGVSILVPGRDNIYYGWGHPGKNPHTLAAGRRAVAEVWDFPLAFHNCKFDIGVALEHMDLPWPDQYDDTMFQAYLIDPLAKELGLKPLAHRWLKMAPEEKDAVYLWLRANFKGPFLPDHKEITVNNAGAYIAYAPYDIVAPYAMGDTARTKGLHSLLRPKVLGGGMEMAYQRELEIAKHGYWMERVGVRVDRASLLRDYEKYSKIKREQDYIVQAYLGDNTDLDKPAQVAQAIIDRGYADDLPRTPTGRLSTAGGTFENHVNDPALLQALRYRSTLHTLVKTFFEGWINFSAADGHLHPSWNQTKNDKGKGARTGRFSCSEPNLTNVPTEFAEKEDDIMYGLDLPYMRQYILPDPGEILVPADFNGQEMRILADYNGGRMAEVYQTDPHADFHEVASALIKQFTGLSVPRRLCKIVGFSLIYGSGAETLAKQLGVSVDQAWKIKGAYFKAFPGLQEFLNIFREKNDIKTWGGRRIPCEKAGLDKNNVWRSYNYKLCNYLIQGSAADQSKEAIVRYGDTREYGRLLMMVHDELVMSVPADYIRHEVPILKSAMEDMPGWNVPFRVEVEQGLNWYNLKEFK